MGPPELRGLASTTNDTPRRKRGRPPNAEKQRRERNREQRCTPVPPEPAVVVSPPVNVQMVVRERRVDETRTLPKIFQGDDPRALLARVTVAAPDSPEYMEALNSLQALLKDDTQPTDGGLTFGRTSMGVAGGTVARASGGITTTSQGGAHGRYGVSYGSPARNSYGDSDISNAPTGEVPTPLFNCTVGNGMSGGATGTGVAWMVGGSTSRVRRNGGTRQGSGAGARGFAGKIANGYIPSSEVVRGVEYDMDDEDEEFLRRMNSVLRG
ncbi:unnamed protein product, partial [Discosporangium mesarthrocarpum]